MNERFFDLPCAGCLSDPPGSLVKNRLTDFSYLYFSDKRLLNHLLIGLFYTAFLYQVQDAQSFSDQAVCPKPG
jgi:hypothetical protein